MKAVEGSDIDDPDFLLFKIFAKHECVQHSQRASQVAVAMEDSDIDRPLLALGRQGTRVARTSLLNSLAWVGGARESPLATLHLWLALFGMLGLLCRLSIACACAQPCHKWVVLATSGRHRPPRNLSGTSMQSRPTSRAFQATATNRQIVTCDGCA